MTSEYFEPDIKLIREARERIAAYAIRTPLLESPALNKIVGARVLIKPESLQRAGSFKFRGALNRVLQLTPEQKSSGIVAWSSGNHGLAVSYVARQMGIHATVLMPQEAPKTKIEGVRANGAVVQLYDKTKEVREAIGAQIAEETGATIVPPHDDPYVITANQPWGPSLPSRLPSRA